MNDLKLQAHLQSLSPLRVVPAQKKAGWATGEENTVSIRTSERNSFRSCRRNWWFSSENQLNLEPKRWPVHFWLGTGFHYAMEQHYGHGEISAVDAFKLYYQVTQKYFDAEQQESLHQSYVLGSRMVEGFIAWHDKMLGHFTTAKDAAGNPLVEVNLHVPLGIEVQGRKVYYSATVDRIVVDRHGNYWIVDYKTAAKFNTDKLGTDPQISAYYTMFEKLYGIRIAGMIYIQVLKASAEPPELLKSGKLSKSKSQNTSAALYKAKCLEMFGEEKPLAYADFIDYLELQEGGFATQYYRVNFVERTTAQVEMQWEHAIAEAKEMLSADLSIYPNYTRDCMWMCSFRGACEAVENKADWPFILSSEYRQRGNMEESWKAEIKQILAADETTTLEDLLR